MTLADVLAAALRWPNVMDRLGSSLRSDLVTANIIHRDIAAFASDFLDRYDALPRQGDWTAWIETLPDRDQDGVREQLRSLLDRDLSSYTPEFIADHAAAALETAAARTASGRLQRVGDESKAEALRELADAVDRTSTVESTESGSGILTLQEILDDPVVLEAPPPMVDGICWRGYSTLLASREKVGKSTLAGGVASAVSQGRPWTGVPVPQGRVLYVSLDENLRDTVRRLVAYGTDAKNVFLLARLRRPADPVRDLKDAIRETGPDLVVIDTLAELVRDLGLDSGDASGWTPIISGLTQLARTEDLAVLLLHHTTKQGNEYRDSTAIGASVDLILTLREHRDDPRARRIQARGRLPVEDYELRLSGEPLDVEGDPRWEETSGPLSLPERILRYVAHSPGASTVQVVDNVRGKAEAVTEAIKNLLDSGQLVNRAEDPASGRRLHVAEGREIGREIGPISPDDPQGNRKERGGKSEGNASDFPSETPSHSSGNQVPGQKQGGGDFPAISQGGSSLKERGNLGNHPHSPGTEGEADRNRGLNLPEIRRKALLGSSGPPPESDQGEEDESEGEGE